ncbi:hypothetical protein ACFVUR_19425 [Stenotrophomonas bentonitica]
MLVDPLGVHADPEIAALDRVYDMLQVLDWRLTGQQEEHMPVPIVEQERRRLAAKEKAKTEAAKPAEVVDIRDELKRLRESGPAPRKKRKPNPEAKRIRDELAALRAAANQ